MLAGRALPAIGVEKQRPSAGSEQGRVTVHDKLSIGIAQAGSLPLIKERCTLLE